MSFLDWYKLTARRGGEAPPAQGDRTKGGYWFERPQTTTAPQQQSGFMGQMYGRNEGWQDPWRMGARDEPRSASYANRSTGIPQETAWDKYLRTHGDPRTGGTGALSASGLTSGQVNQMGTTRLQANHQARLDAYNKWKQASTREVARLNQYKTEGKQEEYDKWLAQNPNPGNPGTFMADPGGGGYGAGGGTGAAPQFGTPATPEAMAMRDELDVIPRWLQDQYGDIATYGTLGSKGMRTIDEPMFNQEEAVLGSIDPFIARQTGLYQDQTRASLDQIRDQGADRRRRQTRAMERSLGLTVGQRPGYAAQMMAEAAAPVTAEQAGLEFEAGQRGTQQELGLGEDAYNMANQILLGRGGRRSDLEMQNQLSKSQVGLPGVAGANQYMADLLGNRYWDLENPMQSQYSYQSGLMGQGQGYDIQKMAIQQKYQSMNAEQQFEFQKQLMQFKDDLGADDESWDQFMKFLTIGASIV